MHWMRGSQGCSMFRSTAGWVHEEHCSALGMLAQVVGRRVLAYGRVASWAAYRCKSTWLLMQAVCLPALQAGLLVSSA